MMSQHPSPERKPDQKVFPRELLRASQRTRAGASQARPEKLNLGKANANKVPARNDKTHGRILLGKAIFQWPHAHGLPPPRQAVSMENQCLDEAISLKSLEPHCF